MRTLFATFALLVLATVFAKCEEKKVNKWIKKYNKCIAKGYESTINGCGEARKDKLNKKKKARCAKIEKRLIKCDYSCVDPTESPTESPTNSPTTTPTSTPTNAPIPAPTCSTCADNQVRIKSCSGNQDTICRPCRQCSEDQIVAYPCRGSYNTKCASSYLYGVGLDDKSVWRHWANGRGDWEKLTYGTKTQVEVQGGRIIWGLGVDKAVWRWTGTKWTRITPGSVTKFAIWGGKILGLGMNGGIWQFDGAWWVPVTECCVTDFTFDIGYYYGVGKNNAVLRIPLNGKGGWQQITTGSVTQVQRKDGIMYGLGMKGAILKWNKNSWAPVTGESIVTSFVMTPRTDIFGLGSDNAIWKTNIGRAGEWTRFTNGSMIDFAYTFNYVN